MLRTLVIQVKAASIDTREAGPQQEGAGMGKVIAIDLDRAPAMEIDGAVVARGLGLELADFRLLMDQRKITVLCERGTGADAGLYRASFYHEGKRVRLVVDRDGNVVPGQGSR
jgi:hypothetical protein